MGADTLTLWYAGTVWSEMVLLYKNVKEISLEHQRQWTLIRKEKVILLSSTKSCTLHHSKIQVDENLNVVESGRFPKIRRELVSSGLLASS